VKKIFGVRRTALHTTRVISARPKLTMALSVQDRASVVLTFAALLGLRISIMGEKRDVVLGDGLASP
jgi:hypothetical protein